MQISLADLVRDTAIIVIPAFVVLFFLMFLQTSPDKSLLGLIQLLFVIGGGAVAGWLFRKKHGNAEVLVYLANKTGAYPHLLMHSAALAIFSTLIVAAINFMLDPSLIQGFASTTAVKVLAVLVPLALIMAWGKVYIAMQLGQWLFGRAHRVGL